MGEITYSEPLKTVISAVLVFMGIIFFFGSLQMGGMYKLLAIFPLGLVVSIFLDTIFKTLILES